MVTRITTTTPGFDCLFAPCQHDKKGEHGIHGTEIHHAVKTETHDGRVVVLHLRISTDRMPDSMPSSWLAGRRMPPRSCALVLHAQDPLGNRGCEFLGDLGCAILWDSTLDCEQLTKLLGDWPERIPNDSYEAVYNAALMPSETFWIALVTRLGDFISDPSLFVQPDETPSMADVRTRKDAAEAAVSAAMKARDHAAAEIDIAIGRYRLAEPGYKVASGKRTDR